MSINGQPQTRIIPDLTELPRPLFARKENHDQETTTAWHAHDWYQLSYATRGVLEVETEHSRYVAPPHRAILVFPNCLHRVNSTRLTRMRSLYLSADLALRLPHQGTDSSPTLECDILEIPPLIRELIRAFSHAEVEYDEDGPEGRLAQVLVDQLANTPRADFQLPWPSDPRIRLLCQQLVDDPSDPRPLAEQVLEIGISEKTASRLFQRETGLTFRRWRQRLRLLHSLRLLERGERITDTALASGYQSTSAYIQAFREQFGVTPALFAHST